MNRYLFESRKKTFKKTIKSADIFKQLNAQQKPGLLIRNKKKRNSEEFLMKKKTKLSNILTDQQLDKLIYMSKILGKEKYLFFITKVKKYFFPFNYQPFG